MSWRDVAQVDGNDPWMPDGDVFVVRESEKALLVRIDDQDIWMPKSQLLHGTTIRHTGDLGTLVIPYWLAKEKELAE